MSAPAIHPHASSVSSSGHTDGLGRRVLAFDRETGSMLERLYLRPELAAFELALRGQVECVRLLEDERFARPFTLERDPATGELTLVSEFVAGSRLSDLLETAHESAFAPGVDVALGYLLEALPAVSTFHARTATTHGLIEPSRTVLTAAAQVVFLDCVFGPTIERLGLSPARLWSELGIGAPPTSARVRLDATADVAQVALSAIMVVLGRPLSPQEYPEALPSLLMEVVEVAQIRRSSTFASSLQRILQRSLPLPGRRAFGTPDEVLVEVRQLVRREIGLDACHQALVDFITQMDAASLEQTAVDEPYSPAAAFDEALLAAGIHLVDETPQADQEGEPEAASAALEMEVPLDDPTPEPLLARDAPEDVLSIPDLIEIDDAFDISAPSDDLGTPPAPERAAPEVPLQTSVPADAYAGRRDETRVSRGSVASRAARLYETLRQAVQRDRRGTLPARSVPPPMALPVDRSAGARSEVAPSKPAVPEPPPFSLAVPPPPPPFDSPAESRKDAAYPAVVESFRAAIEEPDSVPAVAAAIAPAASTPAEQPAAATDSTSSPATEPEQPESASSRRRKRQQRSARARKDKLRSVTSDQTIAGAKPAAPAAAKPGNWIVSPERAAAFDQAMQEQSPAGPAPIVRPLVVPPAPTFPPQPVFPPPPPPVAPTPALPVFNQPPVPIPPAPVPLQPKPIVPAATAPATGVRPAAPQAPAPLRLKADPPSGYTPVRKRLPPDRPPDEVMTVRPTASARHDDTPRAFPWKLAAAAVVLIAIAVVVGRAYIPSLNQSEPEVPSQVPTTSQTPVVDSTTTGEIVIETQPAGTRVLLDGKAVGETPLKLPGVAAGRHVITFVTSSGEFKRTVRVAAGKTLTLDVPLYSGWVAIFAPIVLDIAENGRTIGTTEQNRLLLPPGRHTLTVSNRDLGYTATKGVEIQAGEVYSVTLDPRGAVNFNAVPWGEVWIDNQKIGDTPIANFQVPLGIREFVFKHPEFGERRVTATVRADTAVAVSADFTKQ